MKNIFLIYFLTLMTNVYCQNATKAIAFSKNQVYDSAIHYWNLELKSPTANNTQIYNQLGFCYFKMGDYSRAIACFEKSLRENYNQDPIKFDIKVARAKLGLDTENKTLFVNDWLRGLAYFFSENTIKIVVILLSLIAIVASIISYFIVIKFIPEIRRYCLFISFLFVFFYLLQSYYKSEKGFAIIATATTGYEHAGLKGKTKSIREGEKVEILDEIGETIQVKTEADVVYWIAKSDIHHI